MTEKTLFIFHWRYPEQMGAKHRQELGFLHQETMLQRLERVALGSGDQCLSRVLTCPGKGQKSRSTEGGTIADMDHPKTILIEKPREAHGGVPHLNPSLRTDS